MHKELTSVAINFFNEIDIALDEGMWKLRENTTENDQITQIEI